MTPSEIKTLTAGQTLRDDNVIGLEARAFPSGRKAFYLYYRTKLGKARHPKIGDCGIMSLAEARAEAKKLLLAVATGGDPVAERNNEKREPTVKDLWTKYRELHGNRKKSAREDQRLYLRLIAPRLQDHRVSAVCHTDALRLHSDLRATPYQANRAIALLSKLFSFSERPLEWRDVHSNPCIGIERYPELKRRRHAKPAELAVIGERLQHYASRFPQSVAFIYLLLYSGARPAEIGGAQRGWLDGAVLRLPDSKTGQREVYLPPQAVSIIESLPPYKDGTITGIKSPRALWRIIRREAGCPDLRLYPDLRRSFASVGVAAGNSIDLIGGLLGHKNRQTTLVYARLMEDAAKDTAASTAAAMEKLLNGD